VVTMAGVVQGADLVVADARARSTAATGRRRCGRADV
jgi:hypothetical protein